MIAGCTCVPAKHAGLHSVATTRGISMPANTPQQLVVISAEPGERWLWCYVDEETAEY